MRYIVFYIIGLVFGISTFFMFSLTNAKKSDKDVMSPTPIVSATRFSIDTPPSESLVSRIASQSGRILIETRGATQAAELKNKKDLLQGERIYTEDDSSVTIVNDKFGTIKMSENSDLSLIQTLQKDFVVLQRKGSVAYQVIGDVPLSIRIRSAVVVFSKGDISVDITEEDPIILLSPTNGNATIGFNDLEYISQVFTLRSGEVYEYNSDERTAINIKTK